MHTSPTDALRRIEIALSAIRVPAVPGEYDIHGLIAEALTADGIEFIHEAPLAPRCRIDFLAGGVGIEVKKGRPVRSAVQRQLTRYLASDRVEAIVLVAEKEVPIPPTLSGKPVRALSLSRFWGVALP